MFLAIPTQLDTAAGGEAALVCGAISQLEVTLLDCCGGDLFSKDPVWVSSAWACSQRRHAPAVLTSLATGKRKEVSAVGVVRAIFRPLAGDGLLGTNGDGRRLARRATEGGARPHPNGRGVS